MICSQVCWTVQGTQDDGTHWYPSNGRPLYLTLFDTAVSARWYIRQLRDDGYKCKFKAVRVVVNVELSPNAPHPTVKINRRP